jgi:hypothetical protein
MVAPIWVSRPGGLGYNDAPGIALGDLRDGVAGAFNKPVEAARVGARVRVGLPARAPAAEVR